MIRIAPSAESAPAGMESICAASDCASWSVRVATRSLALAESMPSACSRLATSLRLKKLSSVARSACDAADTT